MSSSEQKAPETEYRQSFTWNKVVPNHHDQIINDKKSLTEYNSAYLWPSVPKKSDASAGASDPSVSIEPPIVAIKLDAVDAPLPTTPKKSTTISNFGDVFGKPDVLFYKEKKVIPIREKIKKKTEYNAKFRPFSSYIYVTGNGFIKPKNLDQLSDQNKGKNWYSEMEERSKQANDFKIRSQLGHPVASDSLVKIYSQGSLWNTYRADRALQALALATTQKIIEEKKLERSYTSLITSKLTGNRRMIGSAPPSLKRDVQHMSPNISNRVKSPQITAIASSIDKKSKSPLNGSPKSEGKIWIKPKSKTLDTNEETKVSTQLIASDSTASPSKSSDEFTYFKPSSLPTSKPNIQQLPLEDQLSNKSPEDKRIVSIPESWKSPEDKANNKDILVNIDSKYTYVDSNINNPKATQISDLPKSDTKSKPTAKVQPSPASSTIAVHPVADNVSNIEDEVKIIKPGADKAKSGNVLNKARRRLDNLFTKHK